MQTPTDLPKPMLAGLVLSLAAILFGFTLGGLFGGAEAALEGRLEASGAAALEAVYKGDAAAKDAVVKKSWTYLQRAHLHGGAIGTAALASSTLLVVLGRVGPLAQLSSAAFGLGAVLYPAFWLLAGFLAPGLGSTGAAKEALKFLAVPGAGLTLFGALGTLWCVLRGRR